MRTPSSQADYISVTVGSLAFSQYPGLFLTSLGLFITALTALIKIEATNSHVHHSLCPSVSHCLGFAKQARFMFMLNVDLFFFFFSFFFFFFWFHKALGL